MILCDEIISVTDCANMANTLSANVTSTVSINSNDAKVRYKINCCIMHTFLLVIILLFITAIVCYHDT